MTNGFSRSPKLLKGALVEFSERFIEPVPNIIVFQYNPETLTRTLEVWSPPESNGKSKTPGVRPKTASNAQPGTPPETFTLTLELDAADYLEEPENHPVAVISGVADRIAALEMLLYPQEERLIGGLLGSKKDSVSKSAGDSNSSGSKGKATNKSVRGTVPVVIFVWGPGRIVPVRLTSFSVEELAYSPTLYPIRAKVSVGLKINTPADFLKPKEFSEALAIAAFKYTRKQKQVLAAANIANNVESILGLLPF